MKEDLLQLRLNFRWLVEGKIAGCRGPHSDDDLKGLRQLGLRALVRLADSDEADVTPQQVQDAGLVDCPEPIADYCAPEQTQIDNVLAFVDRAIGQGKPVAVSCGAGYGRTGTLLACYLIKQGASANEAIQTVAGIDKKPENDKQSTAIREYAARLRR